jgi:hypothetical protein
MWQKNKGKFHLLLRFSADLIDGQFLQSACGDQIQVRRKSQRSWIWGEAIEKFCPVCVGVWQLCFTSVDDAKQTLANQTNIKVLERALEVARQTTLKKAIETRIKKLRGNP